MRAFYLLIIFCFSLSPLFAAEGNWVDYPARYAVVHVHPGEGQVAEQLGGMTTEEITRLAPQLGLELRSVTRFRIYAYTSRSEFIHDAGRNPLLLGVSYRPTGMILIDVTGQEGPVRAVLGHELTHTLLNERLGENIDHLPDWVNEGLAGYFSTPVSPSQLPGITHLWHWQGILTIPQMESAFDGGQNVDAAYQQSMSMIAWLEYHHPGAIGIILKDLAHGLDFDHALLDAGGLSQQDWLQQWEAGIPSYEQWLSLLSSPVLYAPFALLIVLVFVLRVRRKRGEVEETSDDPSSEMLPYSVASTLVHLHTISGDLAQYPIWDDIQTPNER